MDNEPYAKQNHGLQDSKPKPGWMQLMAEQEEVIEIVSDDEEDSKPARAKPELVEISDDDDDAWGLSDDDEWEKEMAAAGSGTAIAAKNLAAGGLGGASGPAPDAKPADAAAAPADSTAAPADGTAAPADAAAGVAPGADAKPVDAEAAADVGNGKYELFSSTRTGLQDPSLETLKIHRWPRTNRANLL